MRCLSIKHNQIDLHLIFQEKGMDLICCNPDSFFFGVTKATGRYQWKRYGCDSFLFCQLQTLSITGMKLFRFPLRPSCVTRTHCMDNVLRLKPKARRKKYFSLFSIADMFSAIIQKLLITGRFVNRTVTASTNRRMIIGCIDNRFCIHLCNIITNYFKWHI